MTRFAVLIGSGLGSDLCATGGFGEVIADDVTRGGAGE